MRSILDQIQLTGTARGTTTIGKNFSGKCRSLFLCSLFGMCMLFPMNSNTEKPEKYYE